MKCPKCQTENPDNKRYCRKCGSELSLLCPKCCSEVLADDLFCGDCGHDLRKPAEISPVDYSEPQSYTPKHLKDKILTTRSSIEGERKLVTVFFADVANYTAMSEKLDPEEVHQIMDGCFKILMDEIHKYEGTINQFTGDGVMALFGAPVAHEDHAQRACHAALSVQKRLEEYGERIKKDTELYFKMRVGLNSGHVIVGSIGDDLRMDYTAVGDTTNLSQRMESAAEPGSVLISENTHKIVRSYFEFEPIGEIEVKGKEKPQPAYKLIKGGEIDTRIGASIAKGLTRFVGRKNSMPALMEVWEKARSGSGQVVGLVGEAGVGKSRILLEFRNRFPQGEFTYLEGQCLQYGENIIYGPIKDIVKTYFDIEDGDREFIIKKKVMEKTYALDEAFSESSLPVFQDFLSLKVDDEDYTKLEPQKKRERTFETIRDLFIRISQIKPLIIAVEDLHWIDRTSEEFLDYLIEWIAKTPVMLTLLYRTEYRHQWGSKTYYNRIGLDHLGIKSSTDLVRAMLEEGEIAPELRDLILERAAGNPLFMEEFTYSLKENGTIQKENDRYVLSKSISDLDVPDTIQGIIAARMDRLEDNLKRTMQVASVIGRDFAFRILQTITGMREELKSYLLNLQGLEFIYEKHLFPELEYIFKHALTREVAYNSLLLKRRKEIHEQIGQAIEELYANNLEELYEMLAYHYSKSDNAEKACHYLTCSGAKAFNNYSHHEALAFYKQAIMILNKQPESIDNKKKIIQVIRQAINPMIFLSFPDDSLQILKQGEKLSTEVRDEKALAYFCARITNLYTHKGESRLAFEYGEKAFQLAEKVGDLDIMVQTGSALIIVYNSQGQVRKVIETASRIIPLLEGTKRQKDLFNSPNIPYCLFCAHAGLASGFLGKFNEGQFYFEKGLDVAVETGQLLSLCHIELFYGFYWHEKGEGKKAIEWFQKSIQHIEEIDFPFMLGMAWTGSGFGYYLLGDLDTARTHSRKGLEIQAQSESVMSLSYPYVVSAFVEYESGNLKEAQDLAEKALKTAQDHEEKLFEANSSFILGLTLIKLNPEAIKQAEKLIRGGIEIAEEFDYKLYVAWGYSILGECFANTGQKDKALENLNTAITMFKEMGEVGFRLAKTYAVYSELHKIEGDQMKTEEDLNKAIEILKECGADGWVEKYEKELADLF